MLYLVNLYDSALCKLGLSWSQVNLYVGCIKLSYVINIFIIYFDYVLFIYFVIFLCDNSLSVCYLCFDPVMISNLVFVVADD